MPFFVPITLVSAAKPNKGRREEKLYKLTGTNDRSTPVRSCRLIEIGAGLPSDP
jgi:hypothetical protein